VNRRDKTAGRARSRRSWTDAFVRAHSALCGALPRKGKTIRQVVLEKGILSEEELDRLLKQSLGQ
jgi:hypothetical protein